MTATSARPNRIAAGIAFMLGGSLLLAFMGSFGREALFRYSFAEVTFFRCALALIPSVIIGLIINGRASLHIRNWKLAIGLGVGLSGMLGFFFLAVQLLPINDAIVISFFNAPLMAILSGPFLGEKVSPIRWAAVAAGFIGIVIIANPGGANGIFNLGTLAAVGSALCSAATWLCIRRWSGGENSIAIATAMQFVSALICAAIMPFVWKAPFWDVASTTDWAVLCAVGLIGGCAQIPVSHAYRIAPTAAVAPFYYSMEVFTFFIAWTVWGELPSMRTVLGCAFIVGAALFLLAHESLATRRRAAPRPAS